MITVTTQDLFEGPQENKVCFNILKLFESFYFKGRLYRKVQGKNWAVNMLTKKKEFFLEYDLVIIK